MVKPARGSIVLVSFPFSDLSSSKLRPALVLAGAGRGDYILCQITSNPWGDPNSFEIQQNAFSSGSLPVKSYARPAKLFTASRSLFKRETACISSSALEKIIAQTVKILRGA